MRELRCDAHEIGVAFIARTRCVDCDIVDERRAARAIARMSEHEHAIRDEHGLREIVRDEDDAHAATREERCELAMEICARRDVERREWLVEQEDVGIGGKCACERRAFFHPARELVRKFSPVTHETNACDELVSERTAIASMHASARERVRHVLSKREPRKKRAVLKDDGVARRRRGEHAALGRDDARARHREPRERCE